ERGVQRGQALGDLLAVDERDAELLPQRRIALVAWETDCEAPEEYHLRPVRGGAGLVYLRGTLAGALEVVLEDKVAGRRPVGRLAERKPEQLVPVRRWSTRAEIDHLAQSEGGCEQVDV